MIVDKKLLEIVKPENQLKLFGYDEYLNYANDLLKINPKLVFLIQSDETEFNEYCSERNI